MISLGPCNSILESFFSMCSKNEEIADFQALLSSIHGKTLSHAADSRLWLLDSSGKFTVKSLSQFLTALHSLEKNIYQATWKSKSPKRVNVRIWVMLFGSLNCSVTLQSKLQGPAISPSICPLCKASGEDL